MIILRPSQQRGVGDFGWLKSRHSFSFGQYYDPEHMGFSSLRVINDDQVAPGAGFDTHGHKNMEIISYVTQGALHHKDSHGNDHQLPAGEFQVMSAGKGIYHSEYNASQQDSVHFLQIWIEPNQIGGEPRYQQRPFAQSPGLTVIAGPTESEEYLHIKQDAWLMQLCLSGGESFVQTTQSNRHYYVHLVAGSLRLGEQVLSAGDGAMISEVSAIEYQHVGDEDTQVLIFDLP